LQSSKPVMGKSKSAQFAKFMTGIFWVNVILCKCKRKF
jgi:hypothetical protein